MKYTLTGVAKLITMGGDLLQPTRLRAPSQPKFYVNFLLYRNIRQLLRVFGDLSA